MTGPAGLSACVSSNLDRVCDAREQVCGLHHRADENRCNTESGSFESGAARLRRQGGAKDPGGSQPQRRQLHPGILYRVSRRVRSSRSRPQPTQRQLRGSRRRASRALRAAAMTSEWGRPSTTPLSISESRRFSVANKSLSGSAHPSPGSPRLAQSLCASTARSSIGRDRMWSVSSSSVADTVRVSARSECMNCSTRLTRDR
jgi:hypothetical protein